MLGGPKFTQYSPARPSFRILPYSAKGSSELSIRQPAPLLLTPEANSLPAETFIEAEIDQPHPDEFLHDQRLIKSDFNEAAFDYFDYLVSVGDFALAEMWAARATGEEERATVLCQALQAYAEGMYERSLSILQDEFFYWQADPLFRLNREKSLFARAALLRGLNFRDVGQLTAAAASLRVAKDCDLNLDRGIRFPSPPNAPGRSCRNHARSNGLNRLSQPWRIRIFEYFARAVAALIRTIFPIYPVRIGALESDRIGHLVPQSVTYLLDRKQWPGARRGLDLFYIDGEICNRHWVRMISRQMSIHPFYARIAKHLRFGGNSLQHQIKTAQDGIYHHGDWFRNWADKVPVHFTKLEQHDGVKALTEMGIDKGADYACLHNRDRAYFDANLPGLSSEAHRYRDGDINACIPTMTALADRSYFVLRMGAKVETTLPNLGSKVIDYASQHRNDFLDIFLPANCKFMISSGSGFNYVAMAFNRPLVQFNRIPLGTLDTYYPNCITIPKKIWLRGDNRLLTFREILGTDVATFYSTEAYETAGLEIIDNTADEIEAASLEMLARLNDEWQESREDEDLQNRFWGLWSGIWPQGELRHPGYRIGSAFLRENRHLLD